MLWKAISYGTLVGVLGYGVWGASKIFTAKTPDADVVGIQVRTSSVIRSDGSSPKEYIEIERKLPPYQFHGGKERNSGTIPYKHGGNSTRTFFLPKGVFRVSGYAYGDCNFDFEQGFFVSAKSLNPALVQDIPYFIDERKLLPKNRSYVAYDGILRVEKTDNFVFKIESDSPLWGMRVERLKGGSDIRWDGEKVGLKKNSDPKHCWSEDRIIREENDLYDKRERERLQRLDKEAAKRDREWDRLQSERQRRSDRDFIIQQRKLNRELDRINR
ncbi:hypothetical protein OAL66_01740 [bacterium]|nr:hypothetical protein [bacterium]